MGFSIIENNNTFDMIYININERISDKDFLKTIQKPLPKIIHYLVRSDIK